MCIRDRLCAPPSLSAASSAFERLQILVMIPACSNPHLNSGAALRTVLASPLLASRFILTMHECIEPLPNLPSSQLFGPRRTGTERPESIPQSPAWSSCLAADGKLQECMLCVRSCIV
eukprot:1880342-Amphidinium_carterae.1